MDAIRPLLKLRGLNISPQFHIKKDHCLRTDNRDGPEHFKQKFSFCVKYLNIRVTDLQIYIFQFRFVANKHFSKLVFKLSSALKYTVLHSMPTIYAYQPNSIFILFLKLFSNKNICTH